MKRPQDTVAVNSTGDLEFLERTAREDMDRMDVEAARAALQFAFTRLDQPEVISLIVPENEPSIRVAERLGETRDGATDVLGRQALIYRITPAAWERRRESK